MRISILQDFALVLRSMVMAKKKKKSWLLRGWLDLLGYATVFSE
jgi:hypothetical protein